MTNQTLPDTLIEAYKHLGIKEIKGKNHNQEILKWYKELKMSGIKDDETSWCGTFCAKVAKDAGRKYPKDFMGARNWLKVGTKLNKPALGAIVVFWRGSKNSWSGHVGIIAGKDKNGNLAVLGGNQSDMVKISPYTTDRVLGYIWLHKTDGTGTIPFEDRYKLPIVSTDGKYQTNEA